jgi:hypothetical protein
MRDFAQNTMSLRNVELEYQFTGLNFPSLVLLTLVGIS